MRASRHRSPPLPLGLLLANLRPGGGTGASGAAGEEGFGGKAVRSFHWTNHDAFHSGEQSSKMMDRAELQPTPGWRHTMNLQAKLQEAIKARDDLARDLLRIIMGEVSTRQARTGKEPPDAEVHGIVRSMMTNNSETRKELEKRGQTTHEGYARLARENVYLETLLPRTLDQAAIQKELEAIAAEVKGARNDGQATGLAMKHLKQKGLAVLGEDVAAAVRQLRGG